MTFHNTETLHVVEILPHGRHRPFILHKKYYGFWWLGDGYRQVSNIRGTKSQNLDVSRLGLQLSLRNILKPGVKPRMKM